MQIWHAAASQPSLAGWLPGSLAGSLAGWLPQLRSQFVSADSNAALLMLEVDYDRMSSGSHGALSDAIAYALTATHGSGLMAYEVSQHDASCQQPAQTAAMAPTDRPHS